jgi:hypothetical protein
VVSFLPGPLSHREVPPPPYLLDRSLGDLKVVLDPVERQKPLPLQGIEPRFFDLHRNLKKDKDFSLHEIGVRRS